MLAGVASEGDWKPRIDVCRQDLSQAVDSRYAAPTGQHILAVVPQLSGLL